jgi:type VI secretion system protein ImpJ
MKFLSRVVWHEGMHLGPHHFQTQSRYFEDILWFLNSSLHCAPYGFLHVSLNEDALRAGEAVLDHASGIMPDGLIFDAPDSDASPQAVRLDQMFTTTQSQIVLHLAIPARKDDGVPGNQARYQAVDRELRDDTYGMGEFQIRLGSKNLQLMGSPDATQGMVSLPVARILRTGTGSFACDPVFIPPVLRVGASESLLSLLHRLTNTLAERIAVTRENRQGSGRLELGTAALDVANYWFLHALCSALPGLRHHLQERRTHPSRVYNDLAQLAGALSTFSLDTSPEDVPAYDHENLTTTFTELDQFIRRHLNLIAPPNTVKLTFQNVAPCFWAAPVVDERCLRRSRWILGVRANIADHVLLQQTPSLVKVCSQDGVRKLVELALQGLGLMHLQVPPSALHAQADMHYFAISQSGPCWEHILRTRRVGVYLPSEMGNAVFDLTVILENS